MTLLVGIVCPGGAVIAADKQASHGAMGAITVTQATTKITQVDDGILYASSGPVGLGQQICHIIASDAKEIHNRNYHSYVTLAQKKIRELLDPAWTTARIAAQAIGNAALADAVCGSLLAARFKDGIKLIEISPQGGWEFLTDNLPFVCIGSGKQNADPFVRYLRSIFFDQQPPNLNEAVLAAYWTVRASIDAGSPGVGIGIDVFVLDNSDPKSAVARKLEAADLAEAQGFMQEAEDSWRGIRDRIRGQGAAASEPPTPGTK